MARPRTRIPLNVFLNGRLVGRLRRQASGAIDFQYDDDWLGWEQAFPVSLSLPLREDRFIGDPVIAVFDNLLPDNDDIRRRLAERVGAGGYDAYSLLSAVGRDCVGALQFLPDGADPGPAGGIEGRLLEDEEIAGILAMAVGDSRHNTIDTIMLRHFLQTAASAGYPLLSCRASGTRSKTIRIA